MFFYVQSVNKQQYVFYVESVYKNIIIYKYIEFYF